MKYRNTSEAQLSGIKAYAAERKENNTVKANEAIDRLYKRKKPISFESVAKESGVSRSTLYNNKTIRDRILRLRAKCRAEPNNDYVVIKKEEKDRYETQIADYREKIRQLERDKTNLISQLVETEELREEVSRLRQRLRTLDKT